MAYEWLFDAGLRYIVSGTYIACFWAQNKNDPNNGIRVFSSKSNV
jgi:hypothetical protein